MSNRIRQLGLALLVWAMFSNAEAAEASFEIHWTMRVKGGAFNGYNYTHRLRCSDSNRCSLDLVHIKTCIRFDSSEPATALVVVETYQTDGDGTQNQPMTITRKGSKLQLHFETPEGQLKQSLTVRSLKGKTHTRFVVTAASGQLVNSFDKNTYELAPVLEDSDGLGIIPLRCPLKVPAVVPRLAE